MSSGVRGVYLKLTISKRVRGNIKTTAPLLSKMPPDALQYTYNSPKFKVGIISLKQKIPPLKRKKWGVFYFLNNLY